MHFPTRNPNHIRYHQRRLRSPVAEGGPYARAQSSASVPHTKDTSAATPARTERQRRQPSHDSVHPSACASSSHSCTPSVQPRSSAHMWGPTRTSFSAYPPPPTATTTGRTSLSHEATSTAEEPTPYRSPMHYLPFPIGPEPRSKRDLAQGGQRGLEYFVRKLEAVAELSMSGPDEDGIEEEERQGTPGMRGQKSSFRMSSNLHSRRNRSGSQTGLKRTTRSRTTSTSGHGPPPLPPSSVPLLGPQKQKDRPRVNFSFVRNMAWLSPFKSTLRGRREETSDSGPEAS